MLFFSHLFRTTQNPQSPTASSLITPHPPTQLPTYYLLTCPTFLYVSFQRKELVRFLPGSTNLSGDEHFWRLLILEASLFLLMWQAMHIEPQPEHLFSAASDYNTIV